MAFENGRDAVRDRDVDRAMDERALAGSVQRDDRGIAGWACCRPGRARPCRRRTRGPARASRVKGLSAIISGDVDRRVQLLGKLAARSRFLLFPQQDLGSSLSVWTQPLWIKRESGHRRRAVLVFEIHKSQTRGRAGTQLAQRRETDHDPRHVRIVIVGGGAAGGFASLLLARAGHEVVVVEKDRLEPAPDVEAAAASAFRASAPQIVQPHIVMARFRELARELMPDLYDGLLAAGVAEAPLTTQMAPSLADRSSRPGDERLTVLATRRSTIDWVLARTLLDEPGVTIRFGVRGLGLLAEPGDPPHVTGVRTDAEEIPADLVVDATGRRSPIDRWLEEIGARPTATWRAECGIAYFSRHYRLRPGLERPGPPTTRVVMGLDEFTIGIWGGDNGAMQLAVAPLDVDRRFRTLKHPHVFTAVLQTVPTYAAWLDALDPITPVFPMAGLHNTLRRLVVDGAPVATGLHAIGDSVCTTNPTLGRGLSLALWGAADLVDVLARTGGDRTSLAIGLDALVADHVAPFYEDQAAADEARLARLRHTILGDPEPAPAPANADRVNYAQLRTAALFDPTAFRAFWNVMGMMRRPDEVYADPRVVACTRDVIERDGGVPTPVQPTRNELLTALTA